MTHILLFAALFLSPLAFADVAPGPSDEENTTEESDEDTDSGEAEKQESGDDSGCSTVSASGYFAGTILPIIMLGGTLMLRNRKYHHK